MREENECRDWGDELRRATNDYNALLKRLAEEQCVCVFVSTSISVSGSGNGVVYNVLHWNIYAAPMAGDVETTLPELEAGSPELEDRINEIIIKDVQADFERAYPELLRSPRIRNHQEE